MPSLAEFQRDFAAGLLSPVAGDSQPAIGRRVHRNTVSRALIDALIANYPTVEVLMGSAWLAGAARDYVQQYPPRHAVLADYGECFPDFLRAMDTAAWPYLPDVAALDLAWTIAFLAPDVSPLMPDQLARMEPGDLAALRLRLQPGATFGVYAHSAVSVWRANRPPAVPPAALSITNEDEVALMLRNRDGVVLLSLDAAAQVFLQAITAGDNILDAAASAMQLAPQGEVAGGWSALLAQGAFSAIQHEED